jgi:hypothetical protein
VEDLQGGGIRRVVYIILLACSVRVPGGIAHGTVRDVMVLLKRGLSILGQSGRREGGIHDEGEGLGVGCIVYGGVVWLR